MHTLSAARRIVVLLARIMHANLISVGLCVGIHWTLLSTLRRRSNRDAQNAMSASARRRVPLWGLYYSRALNMDKKLI